MAKVKKIVGPPVKTTKVKLLKNVILGAGQDGYKGEIYELPLHQALELIGSGKAIETDEGDPAQFDERTPAEKETFGTVTLDKPTTRDPKPAKRG